MIFEPVIPFEMRNQILLPSESELIMNDDRLEDIVAIRDRGALAVVIY